MTDTTVTRPRRTFTWPSWGWSLLGVIAVWAVIIAVRPGNVFDPLTQALSLAPFLVLVALGQMLVITLGPGNIDVSVGTIISMASYVSVAVGGTAGPIVGLAAGTMSGVAAGLISVLAILLLRVPPIIATLATSLIVTSATLLLADAARGAADPGLRAFVNAKVLGIPVLAIAVALLTVAVWFLLTRTRLGVGIIATGQSERAAERAGLPVTAVTATVYLTSAGLAGLAGGLLAAFISPSTVLGSSYMLDSIAVVVIGGTLISGGRPVPAGAWTGALFFGLLSGLLNLVGWSVGAQNVLKGVLVVLVVIVAATVTGTGRSSLRRLRDNLAPRPVAASEPTTQHKEKIHG